MVLKVKKLRMGIDSQDIYPLPPRILSAAHNSISHQMYMYE